MQLNPRHVKAYYNRAVALERLGRPEEALADYSRVAQLDEGNSAAHLNAGLLLCKLGRWEKRCNQAKCRKVMCT